MKKAFTLVEIVVAIAIIGALVSIMVPVIIATRNTSQRARCFSNLHQVGLAVGLYAAESDDRLPAAIDPWKKYMNATFRFPPDSPTVVSALVPYSGSGLLFACPLDKGAQRSSEPVAVASFFDLVRSSYEFPSLPRGLSLSGISQPSTTIYSSDYSGFWHVPASPDHTKSRWSYLLLDGHVWFGYYPESGTRIPEFP